MNEEMYTYRNKSEERTAESGVQWVVVVVVKDIAELYFLLIDPLPRTGWPLNLLPTSL